MMKFPWSANAASENPDYLAEYREYIVAEAAYLAERSIEVRLPGPSLTVVAKSSAA